MNSVAEKRDIPQAPGLPRGRSWLVLILLLASFAGLTGRAMWLQGKNSDFLQAKGEARYARAMDIPPSRGVIVDRNNQLLAISTPVESVAASPADVAITNNQLRNLAKLLQLQEREIAKKVQP